MSADKTAHSGEPGHCPIQSDTASLADHLVDFMEQWEQFLPMTEQLEAGIETAELARLLTAVDAGVLLTPSGILRRVIKQDRRLIGIGLQVPHRKVYVIGREALLAIAGR